MMVKQCPYNNSLLLGVDVGSTGQSLRIHLLNQTLSAREVLE